MATETPFNPTRLIVLSELSTKEKEKYYNLLIANEAKFHKNDSGQYIANVRLLAPGVKKFDPAKQRKGPHETNSLLIEERLKRLHEEGRVLVKMIGVDDFDYSAYPRFSVLIANDGDKIQPRPKLLSWLMRCIEDLYDSRFAHEAAEIGREDTEDTDNESSIFPVFVVRRMSMKVGLRTLVDQTCWDLLYNSHVYRRDYLEVEMFCRFLQEFYDHDDLLFFLYVRSVVAKQLHVSFKTRWAKSDGPGRQPKSLWLSFRECVSVARVVFGDANEAMCRDFLAIVTPQMVGQKSDGAGCADTRRIDITQFLHLAVVGYHQTRPPDDFDDGMGGPVSSQGGGGDRVGGPGALDSYAGRPIPGEVVPPVPPVAPSNGDYMSRFAPRSSALKQQDTGGSAAVSGANAGGSASHGIRRGGSTTVIDAVNQDSKDVYYGDHVEPTGRAGPNSSYGMFSPEDEAYLSRMQRDREEMLEMQRQMQMAGEEGGGDSFDERYYTGGGAYGDHDASMMYTFNGESDNFMDPMLSGDGHYDLVGLAGESPIALAQSGRQPSSGLSSSRGQRKDQRLSLADFTKQRQQMQALERQYEDPASNYDDDDALEQPHYTANGGGYDGMSADSNLDRELSELQADREKEFLGLFCERLSGYPEEVAVSIIDELADRLREKVTAYLSQHTVPQDINSFDDLLVQYLQSEELQHDMENARDLMLAYVQQRMGDGGNDDHGYN